MAPSEPHVEYSKNSWSEPGMAGITYEQFERGSIVPDGCQPGRFATCGGDVAPNAVLETLMAALDALDDGETSPIAEMSPATIEAEPPSQSSLLFKSQAAANAAMLKAARDAQRQKIAERQRREEEARLAAKIERKREAARERQRRKRARDRAVHFDLDAFDTFAPDRDCGIAVPYHPIGFARQFDKRFAALRAATANHAGDPFLKQLQGREHEYAVAWVTRELVRKRLAGKVSARNVAKHHPDKSMTKRRAERLLEKVAKLEQPGRPWHGIEA